MAFTLNTVDITTYGIKAGQVPGSNLALSGMFDFPARTGKVLHSWADEHSIEPYTAATDIIFEGRDLFLHGVIIGSGTTINTYVAALKTAVKAFTGLVTLSTPYGDFSVYVKDIKTEKYNGAAKIIIEFREPVVTLTGGTLPAFAASDYKIDGIPMSSFGLYVSKAMDIHDLPGLKDQLFTIYGSEGYQITKRDHETLNFDGFLKAASLSDFQSKIRALYLLFKSAGRVLVEIKDEPALSCFLTSGFKVENVIISSGLMIARFRASMIIINSGTSEFLATSESDLITADSFSIII